MWNIFVNMLKALWLGNENVFSPINHFMGFIPVVWVLLNLLKCHYGMHGYMKYVISHSHYRTTYFLKLFLCIVIWCLVDQHCSSLCLWPLTTTVLLCSYEFNIVHLCRYLDLAVNTFAKVYSNVHVYFAIWLSTFWIDYRNTLNSELFLDKV